MISEVKYSFSNFIPLLTIADTSRAGDKFETISTNSGYSKYMKLKIRNVRHNDFGFYRCVAKNSLGELKNRSSRLAQLEKVNQNIDFLYYRVAAGETDGMIKLDGESMSHEKFCKSLRAHQSSIQQ